jgi:hypothetical protein
LHSPIFTGDIEMAKAKEVKTKLSREDMQDVIKGGGSVLHGGEIITNADDLPDEIDLAETDEELAAATAKVEDEEKAVAVKKEKAASKSSGSKSGRKSNK